MIYNHQIICEFPRLQDYTTLDDKIGQLVFAYMHQHRQHDSKTQYLMIDSNY